MNIVDVGEYAGIHSVMFVIGLQLRPSDELREMANIRLVLV